MALDVPVFLKRTGSAVVFAIIVLGAILWKVWAFFALLAVVQALCLREYMRLMKLITPEYYYPAWVHGLLQVSGFSFLLLGFYHTIGLMLMPVLFFIPILLVLAISLNEKNSWGTALQTVGGLIYITLPVVLLLELRAYDMLLPLSLILLIWTNDTMAYIVGSFIGKTPFSPISPKKTWEGTIGGVVLTMAVACAFVFFSDRYKYYDWMFIGLCASVAGTAGDLLESKLKRMANVKDSGAIMPGHGGALDRFDSLLVAIPFVFCYVYAHI